MIDYGCSNVDCFLVRDRKPMKERDSDSRTDGSSVFHCQKVTGTRRASAFCDHVMEPPSDRLPVLCSHAFTALCSHSLSCAHHLVLCSLQARKMARCMCGAPRLAKRCLCGEVRFLFFCCCCFPLLCFRIRTLLSVSFMLSPVFCSHAVVLCWWYMYCRFGAPRQA